MNLVVVLPLRPGARDRARDLLRHGPPFDPDEAGLERHQAFVSETEAKEGLAILDEAFGAIAAHYVGE